MTLQDLTTKQLDRVLSRLCLAWVVSDDTLQTYETHLRRRETFQRHFDTIRAEYRRRVNAELIRGEQIAEAEKENDQ
jgi:hypothetical protein